MNEDVDQIAPPVEGRPFRSSVAVPVLDAMQQGTMRSMYRGVPFFKSPLDIGIYLQLFSKFVPGAIIEIGTKFGGSALWFADMMQLHGAVPRVVSLDIEPKADYCDPRIRFLKGDARDLQATPLASEILGLPRPWLVVEDSAHNHETVAAVLGFFDPHLQPGDYLVVEDGVLDQLTGERYRTYRNGPNRAVSEFLQSHPDRYVIDTALCDHYGYNATYNPNGWIRRCR